ncbi:MAG: type IV pilin [Methanoregula sp.]|nr:type IV pilin [Methanoregula sp.]
MSVPRFKPDATSQTIGSILMVAITIVLALLVLLLFHMPSLNYDMSPIPQIFIITAIYDVDEITGLLNYDSRVILVHSGTLNYPNGNLKAIFLKNGQPVSCVIDTMNGHDFISTSHFGVQWMGGAGCSGNLWAPGEMIAIDFTDDTFRPGDTVQIDIMDNTTSQPISRHVYHAT